MVLKHWLNTAFAGKIRRRNRKNKARRNKRGTAIHYFATPAAVSEALEQKTLLTAPVIASLTVDTGADPNDFVTNDSSFSLSGTGDPSTIIDIERDGMIISGAVVGSNGAWTFSDSLGDGTFQYVAISNIGERSASVSVVIDTMEPAAPGTPDLDAGSDSGISTTDDLTNDNTPTFTGSGEIGAAIELFSDVNSNNTVDSGESLGTGTVDGSGNWTITSSTLADGTHANIKSVQTDLAGNVSPVSGALSVTVDTAAPTITGANISVSGAASGTGGEYVPGDTVTITWDNTSGGDNNTDVDSVTVDFTEFGGGSAVAATNTSDNWSASFTIVAGSIDATDVNASVTASDNAGNSATTADDQNVSVDNIAPAVTAGNISIAGGSGTGGAYLPGDVVTATWDNSGSGDNNADIASVTVDFTGFGGGSAVAATDMGGGMFEATFTLVAGVIDATNINVSVTSTDDAGLVTTTADDTNATVDTQAPTVTDGNISITTTGSGTGGVYIPGDVVTVRWDNSGSGDNNADIASVTADFTAFGGGAAVAATDTGGGIFEASYTIVAGSIDASGLNASVTATDDAGNATTTGDSTGLSADNQLPVVTDGNISITTTGSGTGGTYVAGDTVTVRWDNSASGDNNADISSVTADLSAFGGSATTAASDTGGGVFEASFTLVAGSIDATNLNASITATDDASNATTTADTSNLSADTQSPTVTDGNISVTSSGSGTAGAYIVGDTITVQWDNSASGDNNADISTVTVDFSALGGGAAVAATDTGGGVFQASYTVVAGSIDAGGLNASVTATDDAGNATTTADSSGLTVDDILPVVTDGNISITTTGSGTGGVYIPGDTVTVQWDNSASGDNNADTISSVTVDFTAFGGGSAVAATDTGGGVFEASYTIVAGTIDASGLNASVTATDDAGNATTTGDTTGLSADNQAPAVTAANISIAGGSGTGGAYLPGDTVTATWDNSASGDNNADISSVTVDFTGFGGGSAVAATDMGGGMFEATFTLVAGAIDSTNVNVSVTATDDASNATTTSDDTNATVDTQAPTVTDGNISITTTGSGTGGVYIPGDTVTVQWDNSGSGDNNADIASVTADFTAFGGGAAVSATDTGGGVFEASYTIVSGSIDASGLNASVTATDDAGNATTAGDTTGLSVDNELPVVTDGNISVTTSGSGTGGTFVTGDTITVQWDNSASGDNNADTISSVTVDFSAFGGSATESATDTGGGVFEASYTLVAGSIDAANLNASVTATDNAGNATTTADTSNLSVDNQSPTVTDGNISVTSTGSGTGGAYIVGDTITVQWDNSASGDNNADISSVTVDFSTLGGGADVAASDTGGGVFQASITIVAGSIDASGLNASVTATDDAGNATTTADSTGLTVDDILPVVTDGNVSITTTGSGTGGVYIPGDTVTVRWDNSASGDNNSDTIAGVTVDFTAFGGGAAVAATDTGGGVFEASYTVISGSIDATGLNASVTATDNAGNATTTGDTTGLSVDNQAPAVTAGNISIAGGSGTGGAYVPGDTVTATWDNSASGDNNADISSVTVDFTGFGGGSAVAATDMGGGMFEATFTLVAGAIDATSVNVSVTATDDASNATTTADDTNATVDTQAPTVTDGNISITTTGSGTGGVYIPGDTVTVQWDNSASGDNNADISSVTADFTAFGGGATVAASDTGGGVFEASYTIVSGSIDATGLNASITATDDAGNATTTGDTTGLSADNQLPTVTDGNTSITTTGSGTGGTYIAGDTITARWDNSASGDNNADISTVTVDFSAFGGSATESATDTGGGVFEASFTLTAGSLDATGLNVSVTATDDASNATTTADTSNLSADTQSPAVTAGNISISGGTGTGGAYVPGDTVTATWDNSASGDNNADISTVTVDFSGFGGGSAVAATDMGGGMYTATFTLVAGAIDATNVNVSVTATDDASNATTTADDTNATVDTQAPTVTDGNVSITTTGSGTGGVYIAGDTVTVQWDNSASGDNNADISTVTADFTAFGGGSAVAATDTGGGVFEASYTIVSGSIDATGLNASVTATDDAGNATTTGDTTGLSVDNESPTVTDGAISVTSTGSGTGGTYIAGDTVTVQWDNSASGDNNADISSVTVDFTAFGGGSAVAATDTGGGVFAASFTLVAGAIDATGLNASVTATDDASNATTTADTTGLSVDTQSPTVTDGNISVTSTGSGTGGTYLAGDTVTVQWDNSASGDNNADISSVTVDFTAFGGGAAMTATDTGGGVFEASYTVVSGTIDATGLNASVTATDDASNATTTADSTGLSVDNQSPAVTAGNISISGATGTGGAYKVGDTVTATWDNSASGDNNADISTVTVDFTGFGGGAAVAATDTGGGVYQATYTIVEGTIDTTNVNVSVTATDDASNATTTADDTNATVDNQTPTVSITGAPASADEGDLISLGSTSDEAGTFAWSTSGGPSTDAGTTGMTYDVTPTDNGTYTVTLMVTDDVGNVGSDSVMITVNNVTPVADDDTESATEDVVTNIAAPGVLDGDTDAGAADTLSVNVGNSDSTSAEGAAVTLMADGSFDYDPTGVASIEALGAGEMLTDSFDYEVNDDDGGADTGTVTVNVTGVNDAPVISNTSLITTLASIDANDTAGISGDSVLDFAVPRITDVDSTAVFGIAIVATNSGATGGTWEFSTDSGSTWNAITGVSDSNALHLVADGTTRVRLVPDGSSVGNGTITFRAWDQSNSATDGMTDDASVTGGQTAYSSNMVSARVVVGAAANDAPVAADDLGLSVNAGDTLNLAAAGVLANDSDQDGGTTLMASPVSSTALGSLTLNSDGSLTYVAEDDALTALADGESSFQTFTYRATDGTAFSNFAVGGITVHGQNDAPVAHDATFSIAENSMMNASVGTVSASDVDTSNTLMYSITDGNTDTAFAIDSMSGEITVANPSALDRETRASFSLEITVSDGSLSDTADVTIHLTGVNEATPTITSSATANVVENTTSVLTVTATDTDMPAETLTFGITGSGADDALFSIHSSTGALTFSSAPDFENPADANGDNVYEVEVSVSDGANMATQTVSVTVTATDDNAPVITSSATASVDENTTEVQTVSATDADAPGDTLTFGITGSGADDSLFDIDSMSGALTFKSAPDAENPGDADGDNVYHVEVSASDGTTTTTQTVAVTVNGTNDNIPVITSSGSASVVENSTHALTVTASDSDDPADMLTFGITGSAADNALFSINSSTGVLTFNSAPDFENPADANSDNVYEVEVSVSDGTNSATQSISITVTGTEDNAPTFTSTSTPGIAENTTAVVTVTAFDADLPGDTLSYGISGDGGSANADNGLFTINPSTGALSFASAPDFEHPADSDGDNNYQVRVTATDGTSTVSQDLTVQVMADNDNAPVITSASSVRVPPVGTSVLTVTATDADLPGDSHSFGITGSGADDARFTIDSMSGELTFLTDPASAADANGDGVYEVQVSVNDGANTVTQDISVSVAVPEVGVAVSDEGELIIADGAGTDNHLKVTYDALAGEYVVTASMPVLMLGTLTMDSIDVPDDELPVSEVRVDELLVTDSIIVLLEEGDDVLDASTLEIDVHVLGGAGHDRIVTGMGDDVIFGGTGHDRINARGGDDLIHAEEGHDTALGGAGDDEIDGGDGDDVLRGQSGHDEIDGGLGIDMIRGGRGSNAIADDVAGNVTVNGDSVTSDRGDDIRHASDGLLLVGSDDADVINAAMATVAIEIEGRGGDDIITGSPGDDLIFGGDGNDILTGGDGDDIIDGGADDDDIMGENGNDAIDGGAGDDRLNGNQDNDTLLGGDGNDSLFGGGQADVLLGEDGFDHVRGQSGDDIVTGAGNGSIRENPGDNVQGGTGTDVIDNAFMFDFDALLPTDD